MPCKPGAFWQTRSSCGIARNFHLGALSWKVTWLGSNTWFCITRWNYFKKSIFIFVRLKSRNICLSFNYWAAKQQTSWVIALWWLSVSPWRICITFVWPRGSLKLTAPSSWLERHLHFASIRLCLALLFIILMVSFQKFVFGKKICIYLTWNFGYFIVCV